MQITQDDLDNLKPIGTSRASGNYGTVKKINDDEAIKIFKDLKYVQKYHIEDEIKKICKVRVDGVALPKELVYKNGVFIGFTMPYYKGFNLSIMFKKMIKNGVSISEDEINRLYNGLIMKVKELSKKQIRIIDIKPDNIIYYNNELCIVDCEAYRYTTMNNLERYNISVVENAVKKYLYEIFNIKKYEDDKIFEFNSNIKS